MGECSHERILGVHIKANNDSITTEWPDGSFNDREAPNIAGIIDGDYLDLKVCIDCQKVIGMPSADEILAVQPETYVPTENRRELVTSKAIVEVLEACQVCGEAHDGDCDWGNL
jgi:hypothetical protein